MGQIHDRSSGPLLAAAGHVVRQAAMTRERLTQAIGTAGESRASTRLVLPHRAQQPATYCRMAHSGLRLKERDRRAEKRERPPCTASARATARGWK
jgi:hypothetical protein